MDNKKIIIIVVIFSLILLSVVGTYAFFTAKVNSVENALTASTAKFTISLDINGIYTNVDLIPMADNLAVIGFENDCVDDNDFNVCQVYSIELENNSGTGQDERLYGTINFNLRNVKNLSYMLLEEDKTIYKNATSITSGVNLSLGNYVNLHDGESKLFYLIVWLSDSGDDQTHDDVNGRFDASITYTGVTGDDLSSMITGTIN